jgi:hypothetical protein
MQTQMPPGITYIVKILLPEQSIGTNPPVQPGLRALKVV